MLLLPASSSTSGSGVTLIGSRTCRGGDADTEEDEALLDVFVPIVVVVTTIPELYEFDIEAAIFVVVFWLVLVFV